MQYDTSLSWLLHLLFHFLDCIAMAIWRQLIILLCLLFCKKGYWNIAFSIQQSSVVNPIVQFLLYVSHTLVFSGTQRLLDAHFPACNIDTGEMCLKIKPNPYSSFWLNGIKPFCLINQSAQIADQMSPSCIGHLYILFVVRCASDAKNSWIPLKISGKSN